jgi:hypothetical protein
MERWTIGLNNIVRLRRRSPLVLEVRMIFTRVVDLAAIELFFLLSRGLHLIMFSQRKTKYLDDFAISVNFDTDVERIGVMV